MVLEPRKRETGKNHFALNAVTHFIVVDVAFFVVEHFSLHAITAKFVFVPVVCVSNSPRGLTFTWWGCYDLCLCHKATQLAHSFILFLYVFLSL